MDRSSFEILTGTSKYIYYLSALCQILKIQFFFSCTSLSLLFSSLSQYFPLLLSLNPSMHCKSEGLTYCWDITLIISSWFPATDRPKATSRTQDREPPSIQTSFYSRLLICHTIAFRIGWSNIKSSSAFWLNPYAQSCSHLCLAHSPYRSFIWSYHNCNWRK